MKIYIIPFICLLGLQGFSQNSNRYFEATYNIYYNTEIPQTRTGKLQVDIENKHSIFHVSKKHSSKGASSSLEENENGLTYTITHKDNEKFIDIDYKQKTILQKESFKGKEFIIADTPYSFNWQINSSEQKEIDGYVCNKATTRFRGRDYIAWYSSDIAVGSGPYKFHGLPGLILEIYDTDKRFIWSITSYKKTEKKPKFENPEKYKTIISLKSYYLNVRYKVPDNKVMQSRLPKGINLVSVETDAGTRNDIEIKFEWEEDTKED